MKYTLGAILLAILFSVNGVGVQIAYAECLAIGGTGLGSAIDESNLVASLVAHSVVALVPELKRRKKPQPV